MFANYRGTWSVITKEPGRLVLYGPAAGGGGDVHRFRPTAQHTSAAKQLQPNCIGGLPARIRM